MSEDLLGYNEMVETAMRSVVRQALERAAKGGLPGNHHFYVTFRTDHPDVMIPDRLRQQYPEEMTIVLQHQFWGLVADDEGFDVELSFNKIHEHLRIPYDSLITFADPSVNFGLQFHVEMDEAPSRASPPAASDEKGPNAPEADDAPEEAAADDPDKEDGDNVVTLDAFRKK
ncbi:MAG: ClpXP protease specificity-enhancing factor SspB [Marivibrio sp.]|uniref:SspB family protein n=1 Tax=Marivibrio sp. TaxID=2039719 RepID=UPI0032F00F2F